MNATTMDEAAAADTARRNKLVINLILVSSFVVILNETMMSNAIPPLMQSLGVSATGAQWVTTAFLLTMAVGIPMTGFLLQRLTTRVVYVLAMSLFSIGTAAALIAPGLELLVVARVIQALGTSVMMPLLMTTVMQLSSPETRGKTMGYVSTVISVAPAIGPVLSGVILDYLHWRWLFVLVLPIALFALWLGWRRIENVTTPRDASTPMSSERPRHAPIAMGPSVAERLSWKSYATIIAANAGPVHRAPPRRAASTPPSSSEPPMSAAARGDTAPDGIGRSGRSRASSSRSARSFSAMPAR